MGDNATEKSKEQSVDIDPEEFCQSDFNVSKFNELQNGKSKHIEHSPTLKAHQMAIEGEDADIHGASETSPHVQMRDKSTLNSNNARWDSYCDKRNSQVPIWAQEKSQGRLWLYLLLATVILLILAAVITPLVWMKVSKTDSSSSGNSTISTDNGNS